MLKIIRACPVALALVAGAALAWAGPAPAPESVAGPDEELLKEAAVGSSDAELLAFLRGRESSPVDAARLDRLVRGLGSDDFRERQKAEAELVRLGEVARER